MSLLPSRCQECGKLAGMSSGKIFNLCQDCYEDLFRVYDYNVKDILRGEDVSMPMEEYDDDIELESEVADVKETNNEIMYESDGVKTSYIVKGSSDYSISFPKYYEIDADKIETMEDVKLIFQGLKLNINDNDKEYFEKVKHLTKDQG